MSDLALKDIISFCEGRMDMAIGDAGRSAYRDVKFLARQHLNISKTNMDTTTLYTILLERYKELSKGCTFANADKINDMMGLVVENCNTWPSDKTGRWVGYVQCLLIEVEQVTTVEEEREFTRPLFHALYKSQGLEIPGSVEV